MLRDEELLTKERIEFLMSWRHSGFSAHNAVTVPPGDRAGIECLARYLLRAPVLLERLRVDPQARSVHYRPKSTRPEGGEQTFEATESLGWLRPHFRRVVLQSALQPPELRRWIGRAARSDHQALHDFEIAGGCGLCAGRSHGRVSKR